MSPLYSSMAPSCASVLIDRNRRKVINTVQCLPEALVSLIAEYDASLASQPLMLKLKPGQNGTAAELNGLIIRAIAEVLTSAQADPVIKRTVLVNAILFDYVRELNNIMDDIRSRNQIINLDNVDLSNLPTGADDSPDADWPMPEQRGRFFMPASSLNLSRVSAVHANFSRSNLTCMNLRGANLTAAVFTFVSMTRTCLIDANLYGARFDHTRFVMCSATGMVTNDSGLITKAWRSNDNTTIKLDGLHTSHPHNLVLQEIVLHPDQDLLKACRCIIA